MEEDKRLSDLEEKLTQLTGNCTLMMNALNTLLDQNIHEPRPPPRGGGGRGRGYGGRGRGQPPPHMEDQFSDSEESLETHPRDHDRDIKVDIPDFYGSLNPEDLLDWLRSIERIFEFKEYPDRKCFKVAIMKFKGYASLWYENLKNQRNREGKEPIKSWLKLKKKLKDKFVPKDYTQDMFLKLAQLKQEAQPIESYLRDFEQLTLQC